MKTIRNQWKKELETFSDKTGNFQITFFSEQIGKRHQKNVKIEDFLEQFQRFIGRCIKTIRHKRKSEVEIISGKNDDFQPSSGGACL